jgi:hypothetical protein
MIYFIFFTISTEKYKLPVFEQILIKDKILLSKQVVNYGEHNRLLDHKNSR